MTWLRLLAMLVELTLNLTKALRDREMVQEAEVRGAQRAMELANARLRRALDARAPPADAGGVRDTDPYLRD